MTHSHDTATPAMSDETVPIEEAAKLVYEAMVWAHGQQPGIPVPKWIDGGNSDAQYEARRVIRKIAALSTPTEGPASQAGPDVEPGQGSWAKRRAQMEASQTEGMGGDADKRAAIDRWVKIEGALEDVVHVARNLLASPATKRLQADLRERIDLASEAMGTPEPNTAWMRPAALTPPETAEAVPVVYEYEWRFFNDVRGEDAWEKHYGLMEDIAPVIQTRGKRPLYAHPAPATDDRERLVEADEVARQRKRADHNADLWWKVQERLEAEQKSHKQTGEAWDAERAAHEKTRADLRACEIAFNVKHETKAERDVLTERARQKAVEGYDEAHDDEHLHGQLGDAAACYALAGSGTVPRIAAMPPGFWPWDLKWWKPTTDRRDLVKAGALILAAIERLDRAALATEASR